MPWKRIAICSKTKVRRVPPEGGFRALAPVGGLIGQCPMSGVELVRTWSAAPKDKTALPGSEEQKVYNGVNMKMDTLCRIEPTEKIMSVDCTMHLT
ncbi:hypothetical protein NPIL_663131 [Nephila pilipes]|uniref:Uncharacterized protein n=1 Tax=Nephila pilipes TaxID=299642 RepID=A0A8X6Q4N9_NEPPI|nr:hypothetical protein NPIL_663131 [Nephila pilipes]